MSTERDGSGGRVLQVEGSERVVLPGEGPRESGAWTIVRDSIGFECASGDWIEREWVGVPVLELLDAADIPGETTHVLFESDSGERACVPLTDLDGAIVAVGDGDGLPRFVSPHVIGPRTVKRLERIRPVSLAPEEDREAYEELALDEK